MDSNAIPTPQMLFFAAAISPQQRVPCLARTEVIDKTSSLVTNAVIFVLVDWIGLVGIGVVVVAVHICACLGVIVVFQIRVVVLDAVINNSHNNTLARHPLGPSVLRVDVVVVGLLLHKSMYENVQVNRDAHKSIQETTGATRGDQ